MVNICRLLHNAEEFNRARRRIVGRKSMSKDAHNVTAMPVRVHVEEINDPNDIITPEELATRLKADPKWIYEKQRKRCKNPIPSIPTGRYIRFSWKAVCRWLVEQANQRADVAAAPRRRKAS